MEEHLDILLYNQCYVFFQISCIIVSSRQLEKINRSRFLLEKKNHRSLAFWPFKLGEDFLLNNSIRGIRCFVTSPLF